MKASILYGMKWELSDMMAGQLACHKIEDGIATIVANRVAEYINKDGNDKLKASREYDEVSGRVVIDIDNLTIDNATELLDLFYSKHFLETLGLNEEDCRHFKPISLIFDKED